MCVCRISDILGYVDKNKQMRKIEQKHRNKEQTDSD